MSDNFLWFRRRRIAGCGYFCVFSDYKENDGNIIWLFIYAPVNHRQMTCAQTLEKIMMEAIRVTRTVLASGTRTGKYIVCLYSFSCDFLVQLHVWSFVVTEWLCSENVFALKRFHKLRRKKFEKVDYITLHPGFSSVCLDVWVLQTAYFLLQ